MIAMGRDAQALQKTRTPHDWRVKEYGFYISGLALITDFWVDRVDKNSHAKSGERDAH